ncbi:hypothetical protein PMAYCL1PPCAC_16867, partial [Pristionchus mayeri]
QVIEYLGTLPKFKRNERDFDSFANEFIGELRLTKIDLEVKSTKFVFGKLFENDERTLYDSIPEDLKTNDDWEAYLNALMHIFHTSQDIRFAQQELMGLKQRCDESALSFRSRIEKTARFAFPFNPEHRVTPTLEVFISGLKDTIRWKIYDDEEPRNLSKTYELARSEAQNGKSSCDRVAAQVKRKLRDYVARGNNIKREQDLFNGIHASGLRGVSVYLAKVTREKTEEKEKALAKKLQPNIAGISSYGHFEFDGKTVRTWKLHGIGEGRVYKGLEGYKREIEIILEGGF